jgi:hypothetical protein
MIDQLTLYSPNLGSNAGSNAPFISDTQQYYMSLGVGMFKYPSLMGIFPLPPPPPTMKISPINMISSFTYESLGFIDPWVVPHPKDVESYGTSKMLTMVEILNPKIPLSPTNIGRQLHPHMECDIPTLLEWVVDSTSSHDILDFEFPSKEAILDIMASIDNPKEAKNYRESILLDLEPPRVTIMILDPGLGAFVGDFSSPTILYPFFPWLYFSKISIELFSSPSLKYSHFILPSCLYGANHGVSLSNDTTHNEYICMRKFDPVWNGPSMVGYMMPMMAHDFIDDDQDPCNGIYFA